jgi:uncharacterized membrane protein YqiK
LPPRFGSLEPGGEIDQGFGLTKGQGYAFVVVGDDNAKDVDLQLVDTNGKVVAEDNDTYELYPVMPVLQSGLVEGLGSLLGLGVLAIVGYAALRPAFLIPDPNEALIVRGGRGTKVVHDRGVFLFGARNITRVSLNKNEVTVNMSGGSEPVRTADFFKANIPVTVDVAVAKNDQSILTAAERLTKNNRVDDNAIKEAADAQLKDAIRGAAKEMTLDQIDRDKKGFESRVRAAIQEDLTGYGLVVISISIKEITECNRYDPNDVLDAQSLENRTKTTEEAKRAKERLEKETEVINHEIRLQTERKVLGYQLEEERVKAQNKIETEKLQAEANARVDSEKAAQDAAAKEKKSEAEQRIAKAQQNALQTKQALAIAEEQLTTAKAQQQAEREKIIAILNAEKEAQVQTAALVAEARAKAEADLALAEAQVKVAKAQAEAMNITAEAEKLAKLAASQGIRAMIDAQNSASTTAIIAQFLERHGDKIIEKMPETFRAIAPPAGVLGTNPTIIGGQGEVGNILWQSSAAALVQSLIGEGKLQTIVDRFAGSDNKPGEDGTGHSQLQSFGDHLPLHNDAT